MEISNSDFRATDFSKHPGECVDGHMAIGGEEYGTFLESCLEQRASIVRAYLKVLENMQGPIAVDDELPFPKELIGQAILCELAEEPECDQRHRLQIAYILLESFIPYEEYRIIENFKRLSLCAQQLADMADPTSILRSAQMMKKVDGDYVVELQEKIHEKMRKREKDLNM
jgi:hypothetical protein